MAGEISFTPSEADYVAANRDWFRRILRRRRMVKVALATAAVTGLIGGLAAWLEDAPEDVLPTAIGFAFLGFAMLALILGASWLRQPQRSRRLYRQQKFLQHPWQCAWSDEGLGITTSLGTTRIPWDDLHRWSEGPHTFLFMMSEQSFYFIPLNRLSPAQVEDLRSLASRSGPPRL